MLVDDRSLGASFAGAAWCTIPALSTIVTGNTGTSGAAGIVTWMPAGGGTSEQPASGMATSALASRFGEGHRTDHPGRDGDAG